MLTHRAMLQRTAIDWFHWCDLCGGEVVGLKTPKQLTFVDDFTPLGKIAKEELKHAHWSVFTDGAPADGEIVHD
jgi:hypothetical protein